MIDIQDIDFSGFADREQNLKKIGRFNSYQPMYYRPSVFFHSQKLFYLLQEILAQPSFKGYDQDRILVMALAHDDAEIVTGEIQAGNKSKMSAGQMKQVNQNEETAIEQLAKEFPSTISGYNYKSLLLEIYKKNTLESQLVKYFDRFDALGESLHELYGGNPAFAKNTVNEFGTIPLPTDYYVEQFNNYQKNYPLLADFIGTMSPLKKIFKPVNTQKILQSAAKHTPESLVKLTGNSDYDWWKKVLIARGGKGIIAELTTQKES